MLQISAKQPAAFSCRETNDLDVCFISIIIRKGHGLHLFTSIDAIRLRPPLALRLHMTFLTRMSIIGSKFRDAGKVVASTKAASTIAGGVIVTVVGGLALHHLTKSTSSPDYARLIKVEDYWGWNSIYYRQDGDCDFGYKQPLNIISTFEKDILVDGITIEIPITKNSLGVDIIFAPAVRPKIYLSQSDMQADTNGWTEENIVLKPFETRTIVMNYDAVFARKIDETTYMTTPVCELIKDSKEAKAFFQEIFPPDKAAMGHDVAVIITIDESAHRIPMDIGISYPGMRLKTPGGEYIEVN